MSERFSKGDLMSASRCITGLFTLALMVPGAGLVCAQDYPNKPIRLITAPAGGGTDFVARLLAPMAGSLGQPVVVDNRTTFLAPELVSKAPADGYTLLVSGANVWIGQLLRPTPYDVVRDFAPISLIERTVGAVAVNPSVPAKSIKELIAMAKAKPGELNYASSSLGGGAHLAAELFKSLADINLHHVPYKGTGPSITALISGEVQVAIFDVGVIAPHAKSGKLRALAVTSSEPSALFPGLPTVAASVPGYEATGMTGLWAPAKTPVAIINRLNQEVVRVLNRPDVKEKFVNAGVETVGSSPDQFAATIKSDMARWSKVIKSAGIKLD